MNKILQSAGKEGIDSVITKKIYSTYDYSLFKKLKGNREVNWKHVKNLAKDIKAHNLLKKNPIIVNQWGEIIDGQNRLEACKLLQIKIWFVIWENAGIKECIALNIRDKSWQNVDFLHSYIDRGHKDYNLLEKFITWSTLKNKFATILKIFETKSEDFKDGKFLYPKDDSQQRKIMNWFHEFVPLVQSFAYKSHFVEAILTLKDRPNYYHKKMISKLKKIDFYKLTEALSNDRKSIRATLLEVYNKSEPSSSQVFYDGHSRMLDTILTPSSLVKTGDNHIGNDLRLGKTFFKINCKVGAQHSVTVKSFRTAFNKFCTKQKIDKWSSARLDRMMGQVNIGNDKDHYNGFKLIV